MGKKAGSLLWRRARIALTAASTDFDTGLTQLSKPFQDMSSGVAGSQDSGEPTMGVVGTVSPAPGTTPVSRIMVVPLAPTSAWTSVTHGEPYFHSGTQTVHVLFTNSSSPLTTQTINVLFWDPHSIDGPGMGHTYG